MKELPPLTPEEIVEFARGIVTMEYLVADPNDRDWMTSLALLLGNGVPQNTGCVLVPLGPHMSGYWLNNRVPGVTLRCTLIPAESLEALNAEYVRMWNALHPDDPFTAEEVNPDLGRGGAD